MPLSPKMMKGLWASVAALVLLSGVAFAVVRDDDTVETTGATEATTTTAADDGDPEPEGGDDGDGAAGEEGEQDPTATTASGPATTAAPNPTTGASGGGQMGTPSGEGGEAQPGPVQPPRPGSYTYEVTTSDGKQDTTTVWSEISRKGSEVRYRMQTSGQAQGQTGSATSEIAFQPEQVLLLKSEFQFGAQGGECDWEPDIVEMKLPLQAGATWKSSGSCTIQYGATPVTITRSLESTVDEQVTDTIGGQTVVGWRITTKETSGTASQKNQRTEVKVFSPDHGLTVRSTTTTTNREGQPVTVETVLKSLNPS